MRAWRVSDGLDCDPLEYPGEYPDEDDDGLELDAPACIHCGCTEFTACEGGCGWASDDPPICDSPPCLAAEKKAQRKRKRPGARQ